MNHPSKHVLVLGLGRSGRAALDLLRRQDARVSVYDQDPSRLESIDPNIERISGDSLPDLTRFDRVIASPGIALAPNPRIEAEIDLAAEYLGAAVVGVTGTNGKSTTTVLIGEMLRRSGLAVPIGGNLGDPLCALVDVPADIVVAELSSFQLEHAHRLHVQTGVLLNLAPDHLDRHGSWQAYGAAKARLAALQDASDTLVINLDDPWACSVAQHAIARTIGFSSHRTLDTGAFLEGKDLVLREEGTERLRIAREKLSEACQMQLDNALASMLTAWTCGGTCEAISALLTSFEGLPHRARLVCVRQRVRWVDDSKATNPAAAAASLRAQPQGTIWLAGGRNKGLDFLPLAEAAQGTKIAILFGEAREPLAQVLEETTRTLCVESLEQAVEEAASRAQPGGTVLLAPACSSFDQFSSFEERGNCFARLARRRPENSSC